MSNATDRRFEAITNVSNRVIRTVPGEGNEWLTEDRAEIAGWIRELARLGRTERWTDTVENWAALVESEDSLEWAFLQGGIWVSHAA